ncbi:outer membrane protein assembly factor BamE [Pelagovum pacificum]|uniref:Outer membrane protein assembly factor BamE n=1 Tax=Pelagovum pacificum TaxID=2588711 RepID=A0A5C5GEZ3_9RHOB|nr:outer membrane protein assembly factor BamE [Pelagovum pacificum]QQA44354.1 outer membrane protein assembly factor BamE [Pelagovum pacificum]TNY32529.1 outer membrane protein assembly factor BamE [Pelagovum pacificum]
MANGRNLRRAALVAGLFLATACSPIYRTHGFVPTESDLSVLEPGVDTRESVADRIGQPTAGGVLNNSGFYYVQSRFRHFGPLEPEEIDREIVAMNFDGGGVLRNVERFGLEDGRVVALSRRVTDDGIRDTTFLRQLIGNIGQIDASTLLGEN